MADVHRNPATSWNAEKLITRTQMKSKLFKSCNDIRCQSFCLLALCFLTYTYNLIKRQPAQIWCGNMQPLIRYAKRGHAVARFCHYFCFILISLIRLRMALCTKQITKWLWLSIILLEQQLLDGCDRSKSKLTNEHLNVWSKPLATVRTRVHCCCFCGDGLFERTNRFNDHNEPKKSSLFVLSTFIKRTPNALWNIECQMYSANL